MQDSASPSTDRRDGRYRQIADVEVVVIGGGQAGLAAGYFLRRAKAGFVILDAQSRPGGAWRHGWDSLRLFSPARYSPLPGWWMPDQPGEPFPTAGHVRDYLAAYEARYDLPIRRNVDVDAVHAHADHLEVRSRGRLWRAHAVISATGTWRRPHWPRCPGADAFRGTQIHTVAYRRPDPFRGQRVVVVGGGNSAAQILAEVSTVATTTWVTLRPPRFLPDDVDGRVLFDVATQRTLALHDGRADSGGVVGLGDIVMVPPVRAARERGILHAEPMFHHLTADGIAWHDGRTRPADVIIWCTGSIPTCATSTHCTSPPTARECLVLMAPAPSTSLGCTCSATETGPAPPRRLSSAPPVPQNCPSWRCSTTCPALLFDPLVGSFVW